MLKPVSRLAAGKHSVRKFVITEPGIYFPAIAFGRASGSLFALRWWLWPPGGFLSRHGGRTQILIKHGGFARGAAPRAERHDLEHLDLFMDCQRDDIAGPNCAARLAHFRAVDAGLAGFDKPCRQRAGFGNTRKPEPFVETLAFFGVRHRL